MEEKIKKAVSELEDNGFVVEKYDSHFIVLEHTDGILGSGYGIRGWQWNKIREILVNNGLDYYIEEQDMYVSSGIELGIITIEESLKY